MYSRPYHPQSNARAERAVQDVVKLTRRALMGANMPVTPFWTSALKTSVTNYNRTHVLERTNLTPYEHRTGQPWRGKTAPFGALCTIYTEQLVKKDLIPKYKFAHRTAYGVFLGYRRGGGYLIGIRHDRNGQDPYDLIVCESDSVNFKKQMAYQSRVQDNRLETFPSKKLRHSDAYIPLEDHEVGPRRALENPDNSPSSTESECHLSPMIRGRNFQHLTC